MVEDAPPRIDWTATTFEGHRWRQHEEFPAFPFCEKIKAIESLGEAAAWFAAHGAILHADMGACCRANGTCNERMSDACGLLDGTFHGAGTTCAEVLCSGGTVPALSEWGLVVLALLILAAVTIKLARRRVDGAAA